MTGLTVPLESVTPLFLGGHEPTGPAELRAASFKGALRFWFRALAGAHTGDRGLKDLRQLEGGLFGSAGTAPSASGIALRVRGGSVSAPTAFPDSGIRYLFFSMQQRTRDPHTGRTTVRWRSSIAAGTRFDLVLQPRSRDTSSMMPRAAASAWLLLRLGALGARSRRGAGGLRAADEAVGWPTNLPDPRVRARSAGELKAELEAGIKNIRLTLGLEPVARMSSLSSFDILHPDCAAVYVADHDWPSWNLALDRAGASLQHFRRLRPPDYRSVKDVLGGRTGRLDTVSRAAFGLPIVFYFRSLGGATGTIEGGKHDRRASPLLIKIERLASGRYVLMFVLFKAALLPEGERLKLMVRKRGIPGSAPSLNAVNEFIDEVQRPGERYIARLLQVDLR